VREIKVKSPRTVLWGIEDEKKFIRSLGYHRKDVRGEDREIRHYRLLKAYRETVPQMTQWKVAERIRLAEYADEQIAIVESMEAL